MGVNVVAFDTARAKILRAKQHVDDVEATIRGYQATNPYELVVADEPETGNRVIKVGRIREPIPVALRLLIGDAAHNLRSALDHFAYCAVPTPTAQTAFPVWRKPRTPSALDLQSLVRGKLQGASNGLVAALTAMQPYCGGSDEYVWAVDYLDITDKHRLLLTIGASHEGITIDFGAMMFRHISELEDQVFKPEQIAGMREMSMPVTLRPTDRFPIEEGTVLFSSTPGDFADYERSRFTFDVAFGEPEPLRGEPVVPTFRALTDRIESLLESLVPLA